LSEATSRCLSPDIQLFKFHRRIEPGSVACDLNSNSIQNFHTRYDLAFLTAAFRRGLTAGAGVIAEPYLSGHHRPEVVGGLSEAEAAGLLKEFFAERR